MYVDQKGKLHHGSRVLGASQENFKSAAFTRVLFPFAILIAALSRIRGEVILFSRCVPSVQKKTNQCAEKRRNTNNLFGT